MRAPAWILLIAGCSAQDAVHLQQQSTLEGPVVGFALSSSDSKAQAGMVGNTCAVETSNGLIGDDHDVVADEEDRVHDTYAGHTLVGGSGTLVTLAEGSTLEIESSAQKSGVISAFLTDGATIGLRDHAGCWAFVGEQEVELSIDCGHSVTDAQRESATLIATDGSAVVFVDAGGTSIVPEEGNLIAWDASAEVLYLAERGEDWIKALNEGGDTLWATSLDGTVQSIDDLVGQNAVMVMVEQEDGSGELVTLDAADGAPIASTETPSAGESVLTGNNGKTVAVVLPEMIHFFAVSR